MKFNASAVKDIDQDLVESDGSQFPIIFFRNGSAAMKKAGGVSYLGGWFITADNAPADMTAYGWEKDSFTNHDGEEIEGYYTPSITIAYLVDRSRWLVNGQSFPWNQFKEAKEAGNPRGATQALVILKGAEDLGPFMVGLKGHVSMAFRGSKLYSATGCLSCFARTVIAKANSLSKPERWPFWAFWLTVEAAHDDKGAPVFTEVGRGETTKVVLPVPVGLPDKAEKVNLDDFYVGDDVLETHKALRQEYDPWARAWDSFTGAAATNGNGKHGDDEAEEEVTPEAAAAMGL